MYIVYYVYYNRYIIIDNIGLYLQHATDARNPHVKEPTTLSRRGGVGLIGVTLTSGLGVTQGH